MINFFSPTAYTVGEIYHHSRLGKYVVTKVYPTRTGSGFRIIGKWVKV